MNIFLKNFGILLIILGVVILGVYTFNTPVSNVPLAFSGLLMVGGIAVHVIINRIMD